MGFMDGARDCEHQWGGILAEPAAQSGGVTIPGGRPSRACKRCGLKLLDPGLIERPPARGLAEVEGRPS